MALDNGWAISQINVIPKYILLFFKVGRSPRYTEVVSLIFFLNTNVKSDTDHSFKRI